MVGLFISLAVLGLAAIDPIGIAAMPILLTQRHPLRRSFIFLGGSFVSLMAMGLLFAHGLGVTVLHFENIHTWLVPTVEVVAGLALGGIAATVFWQIRAGRTSTEPSDAMVRRLRFGSWHLFLIGAGLVAVQSIVDVVFVIAMIRIGQIHLSLLALGAAVATYAVTALVLQSAVVIAYIVTPSKHRRRTLDRVHSLLVRYANQLVVVVSSMLGLGLLVNGVFTLLHWAHF